jgi:DNA-binding CsgD family transcriptional regulator
MTWTRSPPDDLAMAEVEIGPFDGGPPLIVVTGSAGAAASTVRVLLARTRASGWTTVRGWAAPMRRDRVVCTGRVASPDDARRALLAAIGGAGLVIVEQLDLETRGRFLDDLRRLGRVRHLSLDDAPAGLSSEQRGLLALVGEGLTVAEAAAELGLTARTAERRIESARRILGVRSTAEAVVAAMAVDR